MLLYKVLCILTKDLKPQDLTQLPSNSTQLRKQSIWKPWVEIFIVKLLFPVSAVCHCCHRHNTNKTYTEYHGNMNNMKSLSAKKWEETYRKRLSQRSILGDVPVTQSVCLQPCSHPADWLSLLCTACPAAVHSFTHTRLMTRGCKSIHTHVKKTW